ncbi:unnamed protein product [Phytophthora lilii]|uniref:Unnamed protein product n=1 Tax=Phytophthora lilii TaxID=2077276 RepID=A0A9W6TYU5_9STRA|nr:unnamed protein product [Phytophthora lilii]
MRHRPSPPFVPYVPHQFFERELGVSIHQPSQRSDWLVTLPLSIRSHFVLRQKSDMASLYASVAPRFTRELLSPGLRVGYTDEGGVWQFLAPSLALRLPLRAIEWRNLVGVTKRIEQLPLHFEELPLQSLRAQLPLSAVYLVKCEDLEGYRAARAPLAAWVDVMAANKVEWLVLYVPLGTRPKAAGNAPNPVYKKIFDRLRADFAHKRAAVGPASAGLLQERVCKIDTLEGTSVLGQQQQHESQWTELLLRLRRCVMDAFQTKCFQYEESLRVLDAKRGATGWDFGAFFLAKERLALMYQQMYLQDDAIRHVSWRGETWWRGADGCCSWMN